MSRIGLLPPPAEECLERPYPSSQKGGTLIKVGVTDLAKHEQLLCDPDNYRPNECPSCQCENLHVHDYRERHLRAEVDRVVTLVLRFRCANPACLARWQVLPEVIARHLQRSWPVVETAVKEPQRPTRPPVPRRTLSRWLGRLRSSARHLLEALLSSGELGLRRLAESAGEMASRLELLERFERGLSALAALVHRLMLGVRVM